MTPYSDEWQGIKPIKPVKKQKIPYNPNFVKPPKQKKVKQMCPKCKRLEYLTDDHIIPLSILRTMGITCTNHFNIQRICAKCNSIKGSQLDPHNPRTLPVLQHYIRRWSDLYQVPRKRRMYVFRNLPVKSLTPDTYHFVEAKEALRSIYQKQIKRI